MVDVNVRKDIIEGLELFDIHNPPTDIIVYKPEINLKYYSFELGEHRNWTKIQQLPPVMIYDNPVGYTSEEIITYFTSIHKKYEPDDSLVIGYGSDSKFGLSDDKQVAHYLLVAFSKDNLEQPIGFSNINMHLNYPKDEAEFDYSYCNLTIEYKFDYVSPEFRGLGYGFALAKKRGEICVEQLHHLLGKLKGTDIVLNPAPESDLESSGGNNLAKISNGVIEEYIDMIGESSDDDVDANNVNQLSFNAGFFPDEINTLLGGI